MRSDRKASGARRERHTLSIRAIAGWKSYNLHNLSSLTRSGTREPSGIRRASQEGLTHGLVADFIAKMAILDILEFPDPRLRTRAKPVDNVDDAVRKLVEDMLETMYDAPGIGLAATQVDVHRRIIVVDVSENRDDPHAFINPELTLLGGRLETEEGCLSVPGFYEPVTRAEHIRVRALDRHGAPLDMEAEGLLAVCIQHECDHLEGKLFVDYLSNLKRNRIRKKLEKQHRMRA